MSMMGIEQERMNLEVGIVAASTELLNAIKVQLPGKLRPDLGLRLGDDHLYLPSVVEVTGILAASQSDRRHWLANKFDCDDFAYVVKGEMSVHAYESDTLHYGLCVGIAWGDFDWTDGYHAVNWFIANDGNLRFIEPQRDGIYDVGRCKGNVWMMLA